MNRWRRLTLAAALVPAVCLAWPGAAQADDYPSRPIKLLVGASPGGTTDTMARTIAVPLSKSLGQPVLVENKPGAGGNIAAATVAKATPDGYTLLVSFTSHTINATLYPKLPFDPVADFTAISKIADVPSLLVGNPKLPAQNLDELIALAKAKPDTLTIAIGGIGSSLHLAGEQLKMMTGIRILDVPYKGTAPALTDVLGGQVDMMFISLVTGSAQVRAGRLRAYGVTSAARQASFPDLPAIGEVVKGFEIDGVVRRVRPGQAAAGHHQQAQRGHCRRAQRPGDAQATRERRRDARRRQRRRLRGLRARRRQALGADREAVGRQDGVRRWDRTLEPFAGRARLT